MENCLHKDFYTIIDDVYCNDCHLYLGYLDPYFKNYGGFIKKTNQVINNKDLIEYSKEHLKERDKAIRKRNKRKEKLLGNRITEIELEKLGFKQESLDSNIFIKVIRIESDGKDFYLNNKIITNINQIK